MRSGGGVVTPLSILGTGASTAIGHSPRSATAAFLAGITRIGLSDDYINAEGEGISLGQVFAADAHPNFQARLVELARVSLDDAVGRLSTVELRQPVPLLIGVPSA